MSATQFGQDYPFDKKPAMRQLALFRHLQLWSREHVRAHKESKGTLNAWHAKVLAQANSFNQRFNAPMREDEVCQFARTLANYTFNYDLLDRLAPQAK